MKKLIPFFKSFVMISVLLVQAIPSFALPTPAETEERENKKRKLVEATDHTLSGSALDQYADEHRHGRDADDDEDQRDRPKKGDEWNSGDLEDERTNPEDEEFFEDKGDAFDEVGPNDTSPKDINPKQ